MKTISFVCLMALIAPASYAQTGLAAQRAALEGVAADAKLEAIEVLKSTSAAGAQELLLSRLAPEADLYVKTRLIEAVDVNRSSAALSAVLGYLGDTNPDVQRSAVISLSRCARFDSIVPQLSKALAASPSFGVKSWIVNSLSLHHTTLSVEALDGAVKNEKNPLEIRKLAISSMGKMGAYGRKVAATHEKNKNAALREEAKKVSARSAK